MAGGRRIPVTVDADTKGDFDKAARGLDDVARKGDDADKSLGKLTKGHEALDAEINKTAYSVKSLRDEFVKTGDIGLLKDASKLERAQKSLEKLRDGFTASTQEAGKTGEKVQTIDARLRDARTTVRQFADEFTRTKDIDVLGKLRTAGKDVAELEKLAKVVEHLASDAEQAGRESGKTFMASLQGELSTPILGPALIATLVGAAVAAAPAVGAAIGSAVTVGVGGGALAAGIVLAAKDQRVADAWGEFGRSAKDELTSASGVFVEPLVNSTRIFRRALDEIMPGIRGDFAGLAPLVERLSAGVAGFATNAMPGVNQLVDAAGPFIGELADELPNIGNAFKEMFESIAAGGPGALQFFHDLLKIAESGTVAVGNTVEVLSKGYAFMSGVGRIMTGDLTGAMVLFDQFGDKGPKNLHEFRNAAASMFNTVHPGFEKLQSMLSQTVVTADTIAGQMTDKVMGSLLGMGHATLGVAESLTGLKDTFAQNGVAIDRHTGLVAMNTQAGQRNRESVLSAVEANLRMYDAQIASGAGADVAAAKYGENTKALHDQLRQAGLTEAQVHDLIGEYGNVPTKVNTEIAMKGLTEAINSLDDAIRLANHLDGRVVNTYLVNHVATYYDDGTPQMGHSRYGAADLATGGFRMATGIKRAAVGMLIPPTDPGTVLTGEPQTGGEALIPFRGIQPLRAAMLGRAVLGGYGYDVVPKSSGYSAPVTVQAGGGTLTLDITLRSQDGQVMHRELVDYALKTGRTPAALFPDQR